MYFRDRKKIIFGIIIIIIIAFGIGFSIYDELIDDSDDNQNIETETEEEYLTEIDLELYNNDKTIRWNLNSEKLQSREEGNIYNMDLPYFKAYENDDLIYTGEGKNAVYNSNQELMSLSGEIEINKDDMFLETQTIAWNQKDDIIRGEGGVKLTSPKFVISSETFQGPLSLERIEFFGTENNQAKVEWR
ncbi:MAG: LPS export ABC transporter periplasmic protein LptC [Bacillota bacterium]